MTITDHDDDRPSGRPLARIPSGAWGIDNFKEFIESRLDAIVELHKKDMQLTRALRQLDLQAFFEYKKVTDSERAEQKAEYLRRLTDLNHEGARILAAGDKSIAREVYDRDSTDQRDWRQKTDVLLAKLPSEYISVATFSSYKIQTDTQVRVALDALNEKDARSRGIGFTGSTVSQIAITVGAIIVAIVAIISYVGRVSSVPSELDMAVRHNTEMINKLLERIPQQQAPVQAPAAKP